MSRWEEIESRIVLECPIGLDKRPTEADIDEYESASGIELPLDYRRYALAFGEGCIEEGLAYEFYTPGDPGGDDLAGLARHVAGFLSDERTARNHDADPAQLRRLVPFSPVKDVTDLFAWDPAEVTDPAEHEMAIYLLPGDYRTGLRRVASTFGEFLIDYLLKGRYARDLDHEGWVDLWSRPGTIPHYHVPSDDPPPPEPEPGPKPKRRRAR